MCRMSNVKIWALSIVGLLCGWFLFLSAPALMPVVWAAGLAFFIHPLVLWIQKHLKLTQKSIAVAIAIILILMILVIVLNSVLPSIITQLVGFAREFTGYSQRFMRTMDGLWLYLDELGLDNRIISQIDDAIAQLFVLIGDFIRSLVSLLLGYLFGLIDIVIITILLFYFLINGPDMILYAIGCLPEVLREPAKNFVNGINGVVWGYMRSQAIISVLTGIASGVAFFFLGLPFSGLLGILSGILNMIPYLGSIISGVVAVVIAMIYFTAKKAVATLAVVLGINVILGNILTPVLHGRTMGIHPAGVITALVVGNYLLGWVGMLIAVPLVGLARLLFKETANVIRKL